VGRRPPDAFVRGNRYPLYTRPPVIGHDRPVRTRTAEAGTRDQNTRHL